MEAVPRRQRASYDVELKQKILEAASASGPSAAARKFKVPLSTISNWRNRPAAARLAHASDAPEDDDDTPTAPGATSSVTPTETSATGEPVEPNHARNGRRYGPAERKGILATAQRLGPKAAATKHGCSTWTITEWRRQARRAASAGIPDSPTAREEEPAELEPEVIARHKLILEIWRTNPGFGPSQVRNQMRRQGYKVSVHTVRRLLLDNGYVPPAKRPTEPARRYEVSRPMQLYHLDFLHFYVHKQKVCLLLIEDDFSRFIAGWTLLPTEQADGVIEALQAAIDRYGMPGGVMVDRGAAFFSFRGVARFEAFVVEAEMDYFPVDEAPKNGKVEKLNDNVRKELLTQHTFADLDDAAARIGAWIRHYNYRRTHQALGGLLVPADRFHGLAEDALRRIEQGNDASPLDLLTPRDRALELFRVTSVAGRVTVYLMGHKLFESA